MQNNFVPIFCIEHNARTCHTDHKTVTTIPKLNEIRFKTSTQLITHVHESALNNAGCLRTAGSYCEALVTYMSVVFVQHTLCSVDPDNITWFTYPVRHQKTQKTKLMRK